MPIIKDEYYHTISTSQSPAQRVSTVASETLAGNVERSRRHQLRYRKEAREICGSKNNAWLDESETREMVEMKTNVHDTVPGARAVYETASIRMAELSRAPKVSIAIFKWRSGGTLTGTAVPMDMSGNGKDIHDLLLRCLASIKTEGHEPTTEKVELRWSVRGFTGTE
ncbi:hypothetical protein CLAFUW4_12650 [Fulvia fulva]|uniref:Uncharacterized protein n=1 Tax=Passalora fulva TaxID=5499 RepID=A0A9Q8PJG5_PASFU|nr:uncharacterized protein CLAFUR5_12518 [Fulvia fulva]KAK4611962.1 hypothetical protein CLAFUR4_12655 [Fulvia fulva]KAK4612924.1 hypothetical protein CLAFUR0_12666 [Fulvia fulva]UJO23540.1 hypothetical protein CLAFUR5_12518 [Fulvia fulva]WPV20963.1 hypothetical protein CLAFUW4_12650 [Fulvia fulva]WPV35794.1 hypothetical protein CLAFUW7_12657 [Fulvia fulva]